MAVFFIYAGLALSVKAADLPSGASVAAGKAEVSVNGALMTVRQETGRAVLNWDTFSVGQGHGVVFIQPSGTSVLLNRVTGSAVSSIQGSIRANGRIFLTNPNGILFTPGSQVDVGAMVASTLSLTDGDFMAGNFVFSGESASAVVNQGNIRAVSDGSGGVVAMIAAKVTNLGRIEAERGSVLMAAGTKVRLDLGGVVGLVVERGAVDALVSNGGAIVAPGGDVLLTAKAAADLPGAAVNHEGVIEARTLSTGEQGRVRLLSDMETGSLSVTGRLDASAPDGGDGGFIETSAANVHVSEGARITSLSAYGATGTWLLDPDVLQIITGGTDSLASLPATGQSQISPSALNAALTSNNVDLQANSYIDFVNAFTYSGSRDAVLRLYAPTIKLGADIGSSTSFKLGLQFGGVLASNGVNYAGNVYLYDSTNPVAVTRNLTTKGGAVTFSGNIGADSAVATSFSLNVDATGGAVTHNAPVTGSFEAYNTTTNSSVTLSYKPGSVNAQILVDFITRTVRSNGISIPYTGIMPIGFIRLPAQTINLNAQNAISGTPVKCVMTLTDGTQVTFTPKANGDVVVTSPLQVTKITYYTGNASAASFNATGVTYDTPVQAKKVTDYLVRGSGVTLASGATLAFGGKIDFVAGRFVNNAGAYALTPGASQTWRVWSTNTDPFNATTGDVDGGLPYNFKQYNLAYSSGATGLLGAGSGLIYTYAPSLSVALINTIRKTYDGLTSATNLTNANYAVSGVVGGDAVVFNGAMPTSGTYASKNVGTGIQVSVSGISLANFSATNRSGLATVYGYGLPSSTASGAIGIITAAPLTITAGNINKTYGQTVTPSSYAVTGLQNGETLGGVTLTSAGAAASAGVAGSPYAIVPSAATGGTFLSSNYAINYVDGVLTVNRAPLTVTAQSASKTYDGLAYSGGAGVTYSGFVNGQGAGALGGLLTYGGDSQGAVNAGSYALTPGGLTSSNYAISFVSGTLTVSKASLAVTANSVTKTYDGLAFVGGAGVTYAGFVNGETSSVLSGSVTYSGSSQNAVNAGNYVITPGGLASSNYAITYNDGQLAVQKAPLIVTANDDAKLIGTSDGANFAGVRFSGFVNGETSSVLGGSLSVTRTNATTNSVGQYADVLAPSGLTSSNYDISYRTGSFTIVAADQLLVKVNDLINTYGSASTYSVASAAYYSSVTGQQVVLTANVLADGNDIVISDGVGGSASFTLAALNPTLSGAGKLAVGVYDVGTTNAVVTSLNFSNNLVFTGRHTVTPVALTVTGLTNVNKVYDGTAVASVSGLASLSGALSGDTVNFSSSGALYSGKDVGAGKTITVAGASLTGVDAGNYYISPIVASGDITKAPLTVTAAPDSKTYDGLAYSGGAGVSYAGLVNGETSAVLGGSLAYGGNSQGAVNAGNYVITASGLSSDNYQISFVNGSLAVNRAALTVTATDVVKTYGQALTLSGYSVVGLKNGETVASVSLASSGSAASASVSAGPYSIVPSSASGGTFSPANYTISYVNGALTVNRAPLTVTAADASKNYDGLAYSGGNGVSYAGFVNGESPTALGGSVSYSGSSQGAVNAGSYAIVPGGLTASNYSIAYSPGTLTVSPVTLTVTAGNDSKTYDGLAYAGGSGVTYSGFVNGEGAAVLTGALSYSGNSQGAVNAGSYVITPGGLSSGNYNVSFVNGALTVNQAPLTVHANNDAKLSGNLDNSPAYAGATYTGLVNGETSSVLGGTLSIARSNSSTQAVGTYAGVLVPSGLTSTNYAITYQNGNFAIIGTNQLLVQVDNLVTTYGAAANYAVASVSYFNSSGGGTQVYLNSSFTASGNNITLTDGSYVTTFTLAPVSPLYSASGNLRVGNYSVAATSVVIPSGQPNYNSVFVTGAHAVLQKPLVFTGLTGVNKTYDGTKTANISGVGLSGVIASDAVSLSYSSAQYDSKDVGSSRSVLVADAALSGADASNYSIGALAPTGDIAPAALTVAARDASRTYDATAFVGGNGVTYTGLVNGETSAVLAGSVTYGGLSQGAVDAGTYAITPSGLTSANYSITFADGTLTIGKAPLTVTAVGASKVYDGLAYSGGNGVSYSGFVGGQGSAYLTGTLAFAGDSQGAVNVGTYGITPSGLSAGNYHITFQPGSLVVTKAPLVASVVSAAKTYDGLAYSGGNGVTYVGFVNSETESVLGGSLIYSGSSQGAINAGNYVLAAAGKTSGNYEISYVDGALTVGKAALSVTGNDVSKTYDGLAYAGGGGVTFSGFVLLEDADVLGGSLVYSGTSQSAKNVGSYLITPDGLTAANYTITYSSGDLTINKAPLLVTAAADTKVYDGLPHSGGNGVTYSGFVNNENDLVIGGTLSYAGSSQGAVGVGTYVITPSGLTASNYQLQFADGSLTVSPATLRVVASSVAKTYDGLAYSGGNGVTYVGFVTGEGTSLVSGTLAYGGTAQGAVNAGSYSVSPSGLTAPNYVLSFEDGTLTVNRRPISAVTGITASNKAYDRSTSATLDTASAVFQGLIAGDELTVSSATGVFADKNVGAGKTVDISGLTLGGADLANYVLVSANATATADITALALTVDGASASNKVYDRLLTAGVSGGSITALTGDDVVLSAAGATGLFGDKHVGLGKAVTVTGYAISGADAGNYSLVQPAGLTADITRRLLAVTALPYSTSRSSVPFSGGAGVSYSGFAPGDGIADLLGALSFGGSAQGASAPGTYSILPGGLSSPNYDLSFIAGLLTILSGGETVDPIPYLLPPVKPRPFLVLTQPVAPTSPTVLTVGGLNYVQFEGMAENAGSAGATLNASSGESQSGDSGGPVDTTSLPRSIKGPTDVFVIKGGLNLGEGVLLSE